MRGRFKTAREDGRTYVQVVLDLVRDADAGREFPYQAICDALSDGSPRQFDRKSAQQVVVNANKKMLTIYQRTLRTVRGEGYRVARAFEHMDLAEGRKMKANRQMIYALNLLNHVDWDGLDDNQRAAHMAQLALTSAVVHNQAALDERLGRVEESIRRMKEAVTSANG